MVLHIMHFGVFHYLQDGMVFFTGCLQDGRAYNTSGYMQDSTGSWRYQRTSFSTH